MALCAALALEIVRSEVRSTRNILAKWLNKIAEVDHIGSLYGQPSVTKLSHALLGLGRGFRSGHPQNEMMDFGRRKLRPGFDLEPTTNEDAPIS